MRPICVPCMVQYKPLKNGVIVQVGDFYLYAADLYQCPECGVQQLTGFSREPVAQSYQGELFALYQQKSMGRVNA